MSYFMSLLSLQEAVDGSYIQSIPRANDHSRPFRWSACVSFGGNNLPNRTDTQRRYTDTNTVSVIGFGAYDERPGGRSLPRVAKELGRKTAEVNGRHTFPLVWDNGSTRRPLIRKEARWDFELIYSVADSRHGGGIIGRDNDRPVPVLSSDDGTFGWETLRRNETQRYLVVEEES
ncbi:hypothetical protein AAG570_003449 [Ranatra chinensis]|uniref:Uncharacterized protein n=1 Tax=Ranatra chinensis TaxID=642074 RepID=A0ABD0Y3R4_9HEMI